MLLEPRVDWVVVMASGPERQAAAPPPALPVKQRRSGSSRCSSVDGYWSSPSTAEEQNQCNDVFADPMDCQAQFCPIHQRHGACRHQVRFFSDQTPPPVPKKKLARTLSLPAADAPPLSPLLPPGGQPQSFDTPLSTLGHVRPTFFQDEGPPGWLPSLSQLSFDTPDEELAHIFRNLEDQRLVFQGIQHRQTLFLQSAAQSIDAGILLQEGAAEPGPHPYLPQDFLLCGESTEVGDKVFYSLRSPRFPGRQLALRVHRRVEQPPPAGANQQHFNVRHTLAHFRSPAGADPPHEEQEPSCSASAPPAGGSTGRDVRSVLGLLPGGAAVSVERDRPDLSLKEFVERSGGGGAEHHRQLCMLLLQVLLGSQHLYATSGCAPELRSPEVMLVWPPGDQEVTGGVGGLNGGTWPRRRGSPRVVLSPDSLYRRGPHLLGYIKSQIGALIGYCLGPQESLTSSYQQGLLQLASALQSEGGGLQMADAATTLQVLLWGPRPPLLDPRSPVSSTVPNWLTTKRALLVLKLAERGLVQERAPLTWEDGLCLNYLSGSGGEAGARAVAGAVARLWPPLHPH